MAGTEFVEAIFVSSRGIGGVLKVQVGFGGGAGDEDGDEEGSGVGIRIGGDGRMPTVDVALLESLLAWLCGAVE